MTFPKMTGLLFIYKWREDGREVPLTWLNIYPAETFLQPFQAGFRLSRCE